MRLAVRLERRFANFKDVFLRTKYPGMNLDTWTPEALAPVVEE